MALELINPSQYNGHSKHPAEDGTVRIVKSASIIPCAHSKTGWVDIYIYFEDGQRFYSASPSVRGAKQIFAFQCQSGAKWQEKI